MDSSTALPFGLGGLGAFFAQRGAGLLGKLGNRPLTFGRGRCILDIASCRLCLFGGCHERSSSFAVCVSREPSGSRDDIRARFGPAAARWLIATGFGADDFEFSVAGSTTGAPLEQDSRRCRGRRFSMANAVARRAEVMPAYAAATARRSRTFAAPITGGWIGLAVIADPEIIQQAAACDIVRRPAQRPPTLRRPRPPETWRKRRKHSKARPRSRTRTAARRRSPDGKYRRPCRVTPPAPHPPPASTANLA